VTGARRLSAGTTAVVTGAGSGIGRALARELLARDVTVWLVGRRREKLEETAEGHAALARICPTDLTDDASAAELVAAIHGEAQAVDVLAHCAGVIVSGTIEESDPEGFDLQYRTNVRAVYSLSRLLLPLLRSAKGDVVVLNSSIVFGSRPGIAQYAATQQALRALTDTLRREVNEDGIRVLSVFPGRTATPRQERLYEGEGAEYRPELLLQPEDLVTIVVAALELPRTAEVTDIRIRPMLKSY
jgi:NADP-dependent 3-hydroxy acid dehydrogenase YdfG